MCHLSWNCSIRQFWIESRITNVQNNENSEAILKPILLHPNHSAFSVTMLYSGNDWMAYFSDCAQYISYWTCIKHPNIQYLKNRHIHLQLLITCLSCILKQQRNGVNYIKPRMSLEQSEFDGRFYNKLVQSELKNTQQKFRTNMTHVLRTQ